MNKVILMGRLTKDVEIRYTQTNNTAVDYKQEIGKMNKDKNIM